MMQNGRVTDPKFVDSEKLYLRITPDHLGKESKILPSGVRFPVQSVNRGKFSLPADVILPNADPKSKGWYLLGVAVLRVGDLPTIEDGQGKPYKFVVQHSPDFDNYAHSELLAQVAGQQKATSQAVKKKYRLHVASRLNLLIPPVVS